MADTKISALPASTTPLTGAELVPIVQGGVTKQVSVANLTVGRSVSVSDFSYTGTLTGSTSVINIGSGQFYKSAGGNIGVGNTDPGYRVDVSAGDAAGYAFRIRTYAGTGAGWIQWTNDPVSAQVAYIGVDATTNPTFKINVGNVPNMSFSYTGNATVDTGNLVFGTAAKGVNFTANTPAAGMTSQLLNWYEEGTWTPVLTFGGGSTGLSYSRQFGQYTRVGNLVTVYFQFDLTSKGSSTGNAQISGLPFASRNTANNITGFSPYTDRVNSAIQLVLIPNVSYFILYNRDVLGLGNTQLTDSAFTNTSFISGSFSYVV